MRARRWLTTIAIGGLGVGLLSGCTPKDGRTYPNASDVTRAQQVWADPWLATAGATVAGPDGSAPNVERSITGRAYQTQVPPRAVAITEVRAAIAAGWRLLGAQCGADTPGDPGSASAQLARGSRLDDWSLANVASSRRSANVAPTPTAGIPAIDDYTQVTVGASVPHHLDTAWPDPPTIELEASCLVDGPTTTSSTPGPSSTPLVEPTIGRLEGERVDPPTWSDGAEGDLRAAVDTLADDSGLKSLGLSLAMPAASEDSEARDAAMASATDVAASGGLADSVSSLTAEGWTLTYAGCIGPGAPNIAELARPAGKRTAVLRLSQVAATTDASPVEAKVVVSTPGYSPKTPGAITNPCFTDATPPTAFSHRGVPSLGPTRMFPLQR
ncbi:hypothetical protein V6K52_12370 [Knoellia sp. S7-12]|uniref:hypothetical protein n=1 Tax=Knoellia sp. S7-12 TaxID=3126698 RepID=UPI0033672DEA